MPESMDIPKLAFAIEDFLGPFTRETERFGKLAKQFDNLGDVVVIFSILRTGLWVKEVVAGYKLEDLDM